MMSKSIEDIFDLYRRLTSPSGSADLYMARAIDERWSYRVAKDPKGNPAFLVAAQPPSDGTTVPPIELPNISFRPRCICNVQSEGVEVSVETLAVLKCSSEDDMLREYFLRSVYGLVANLPDPPSEGNLAGAVGKLVELFRALEATPRTSLQGIWCELFLIVRARNVRQAAAAWHATPHAIYDFAAGRQCVEVKSSTGPLRAHHFRLDQLLPRHGTDAVIASFLLEESGRGLSIAELWDKLSARPELTAGLRDRLSQVLALGLGRDWRKARRVAFDTDAALSQLRLYDAATIPRVDPSLPAEVTEVQFKSELTGVSSLSRGEVAHRGSLFAAMFG
jgi:hypothetical protein